MRVRDPDERERLEFLGRESDIPLLTDAEREETLEFISDRAGDDDRDAETGEEFDPDEYLGGIGSELPTVE
ncbi:hypothetical protein RYH80_15345 [Halobaculum sp. MBLA0147]|uniref:hypothetical protein n=1 Tax=Halobaculum sp. MBLA0147 TaxID=3079934 RepID=UPI00352593C7